MTLKEIKAIFKHSGKDKEGNFVVRFPFFYTHGCDADKCVERVRKAIPTANIVDKGEVWKPFRGGASVAAQSHWYVKFKIAA